MAVDFGKRESILSAIEAECRQQEEEWGDNAERTNQSPELWLVILVEEVGEVAKEVCEIWNGRGSTSDLRMELGQVAAVAISWIEASAIHDRQQGRADHPKLFGGE